MNEKERHIEWLFAAELQFRLASAVRIATTREVQPLDLPMEWVHGQHRVRYEEIALRTDQADYAAHHLHRPATFLMAVAMKDAILAVESDPKASPDSDLRGAYQIARLVRNAFAHAPFSPTWSIDDDCKGMTFAVRDLIALDTADLHGKPFDWRHYGGPLALFRLCRFVRIQMLGDDPCAQKGVPLPTTRIVQHGDLILKEVDEIPPGATRIPPGPNGRIDLGGGHHLDTKKKE